MSKNNTEFVEAMWNLLAQLRNIPYTWEEVEKQLSKGLEAERPDPVLPYDVAEYLKMTKGRGRTLINAILLISAKGIPLKKKKVGDWIISNSESFAQAWVTDQYKVEPQPIFYWKKKDELCAQFESERYLKQFFNTGDLCLTSHNYALVLPEKEAKKLLGKDFRMFEPVPVEDDQPEPVQEFHMHIEPITEGK